MSENDIEENDIEFVYVQGNKYQRIDYFIKSEKLDDPRFGAILGFTKSYVGAIKRERYVRKCIKDGKPHIAMYDETPRLKHKSSILFYEIKE